MNTSEKKNSRPILVFLHIKKTAGSSFNFVLENSFGLSACHTNHTKTKLFNQADFEFARRSFPRLRCLSGHNLMDPLRLSIPNPFYMTFVREPVARILSHYQDNILKGTNRRSFEESVRNDEIYENVQVRMMAGSRDLDKAKRFLDKCSFVGITERFDVSLKVLGQLSPYKLNLRYKRRRVATANTIKESVKKDSRMIELAQEYTQLDRKLYDFAMNEVFPKLCAKARVDPLAAVPSYDCYASEVQPKFLAFSLYNMLLYRQLCKLRNRRGQRLAALLENQKTAD